MRMSQMYVCICQMSSGCFLSRSLNNKAFDSRLLLRISYEKLLNAVNVMFPIIIFILMKNEKNRMNSKWKRKCENHSLFMWT
jgi:hypothetical protein